MRAIILITPPTPPSPALTPPSPFFLLFLSCARWGLYVWRVCACVSRSYFDGDDDEGSVIEDGEEMKNLLGSIDWGSNPLSL